uniref:type 1 glutamine amidotransferase n=1 Tax=uncultured Psychrobacter sp. TaxID=259303 RepID=UPI002592BBD2|nr:type 1 glutamine amidotransferase [uncultured Psychrobacter sp.]
MTLRIHALFHTDYEDLSFIRQWASRQRHFMTISRSFDNDTLPNPNRFDWLIVMGGPMSVHDEDKYSWLIKEKRLIKQAVDAGKTVIGICLGAQIIAHCLDAEVKPSGVKEIGWLPMQLTEAGQVHPLLQDLPKDFTVFHWHGEGFDCPKGASIIAETQAWANQGFIYQTPKHKARGTWVLAWQCHFEVTKESLPKMVFNGNAAIQSGLKDYPETVQAPDEILALGEKYIEENNARLATMFNRIASSANK